jgi:DNA-binding winged helix-turn-helix (wHTH) protein
MDEPEIKIIDVFICKLRKKLAIASSGKDYIETVWGRGYVLREPSEDETRIGGSRAASVAFGRNRSEQGQARQDLPQWANSSTSIPHPPLGGRT